MYRCVYDGDGTLISRTFENTSTYAYRDKVIAVSPADAAQYGLAPARQSLGGAQPFYPAFAGAISYPLYGSIRSTLRAALRGALSGSLP